MGKYRSWRDFSARTSRPSESKRTHVCFICRRGIKQRGQRDQVACPQCARPMVDRGLYFKVPPRRADNQWRKVQLLINAGVNFHAKGSSLLRGNAMRTLAQAKQAVGRWRSQAPK